MSRFRKLSHAIWYCPISHGMGAQIPLPGFDGTGGQGGLHLYPNVLWAARMRGARIECTARARAFACDGSAKGVDIGFWRAF